MISQTYIFRRSNTKNRQRSPFQKGNRVHLLRNDTNRGDLPTTEASGSNRITRLSTEEARDVQHVTQQRDPDFDSEQQTLAYRLRPVPEKEDSTQYYKHDENIIVHMDNLKSLVEEVHKPHCPACSMYIDIERRHGLCVQLTVCCRSCRFKSKPVEMSARLKTNRGVGGVGLNERLLLTVLKSRLGIQDLNLFLTCLNIKSPSKTALQQRLNSLADRAEEINESQMHACMKEHICMKKIFFYRNMDVISAEQYSNIKFCTTLEELTVFWLQIEQICMKMPNKC